MNHGALVNFFLISFQFPLNFTILKCLRLPLFHLHRNHFRIFTVLQPRQLFDRFGQFRIFLRHTGHTIQMHGRHIETRRIGVVNQKFNVAIIARTVQKVIFLKYTGELLGHGFRIFHPDTKSALRPHVTKNRILELGVIIFYELADILMRDTEAQTIFSRFRQNNFHTVR